LHLFLELERREGFNGTIQLLKNGFDLEKYKHVYQTEIQQQLDEHLNSPDDPKNKKIPDRLRCLKKNDNTTNTNRVSYYLRALCDRKKAMEGLNVYAGNERRDKEIQHIDERDIRSLANIPSTEFADNQIIVTELRNRGLDSDDDENDALLCERCASRNTCNLFIACMINGGRHVFNSILLKQFPNEK